MISTLRKHSRKKTKALSLHTAALLCLFIVLFSSRSRAENIFKHVDASGKITYSTTPEHSGQKPVELPKVQRENTNQRLETLKQSSLVTCERHGGIDCSRGTDNDGSVICTDGFRDAAPFFDRNCLEAKLQLSPLRFETSEGKRLTFKQLFQPQNFSEKQELLSSNISLRNLSSVEAQEVHVVLPIGADDIVAAGPEKVEPYGIADYTLTVKRELLLKRKLMLFEPQLKVTCKNCSAVVSASQ